MAMLSILVPTFNRYIHIKNQVETFIREQIVNDSFYEILISNNHSDDETYGFLESLEFNNVKIFHQKENIGGSRNFNFLIGKASGEFVWLIGDDDILSSGVFKLVKNYIEKEKNLEHILLNHDYIKNGELHQKPLLNCSTKIYENGVDMFRELAPQNKFFFGAVMFTTANIYSKKIIDDTVEILKKHGEEDNLAFPLGFGTLACRGKCIVVGEVFVADRFDGASWKAYSELVSFRGMIAMVDILAKELPEYEELLSLYVNYTSEKYPEYQYMKYEKKFCKDNYAMKVYKKHFPLKLFTDLIAFPRGFRNILLKLLGFI